MCNQIDDRIQAEQEDCSSSAGSSYTQSIRQSPTIPGAVARYVDTPAKNIYVPKITNHNLGTPHEMIRTELNNFAAGEMFKMPELSIRSEGKGRAEKITGRAEQLCSQMRTPPSPEMIRTELNNWAAGEMAKMPELSNKREGKGHKTG